MKKVLFFCLCSFLSTQLLAQPFEKKQITNFDFDSRGATFLYNLSNGSAYSSNPPIFFEAHDGISSNIMMMNYNPYSDSFYYPEPITSNNFKNINPIADFVGWFSNLKINLIWQTNENGNWDIALRTLTDSGWGNKEFIVNSQEDEINPKIILERNGSTSNNFDIEILYEKGNSIYLYQKAGSLISNEIVFQGNGTELYKQPTGTYVYPSYGGGPIPGLYVAATSQTNDSTSKIVYRIKSSIDSIWSPIMVAFDSVYSDNPNFFQVYDNPTLSFETKTDGIVRILIFPQIHQIGQNWKAVRLIDQATVHTSQFVNHHYRLARKDFSDELSIHQKHYFNIITPHAFKYISNDSVFVAVPPRNYFGGFYIFFNTHVRNSKIAVGNLGKTPTMGLDISYFVWEDSSNGKINLFGTKRLDSYVNIQDKIVLNNFILYQNYPNPLNPKTVIKFELLSREFVTLKVFDILGNEVADLVNDELDAGEYKSLFDGTNLASGIYVYRLSVGNNHLSKKMILLK